MNALYDNQTIAGVVMGQTADIIGKKITLPNKF
jgi:hypothetical protein